MAVAREVMVEAREVMEEAQADMAVVAQDGQSQSHLDGVQEVQDHHTVEAQVVMEEVQVDMEEAQEDIAAVAQADMEGGQVSLIIERFSLNIPIHSEF
jgi:hypothetical protein